MNSVDSALVDCASTLAEFASQHIFARLLSLWPYNGWLAEGAPRGQNQMASKEQGKPILLAVPFGLCALILDNWDHSVHN